MKYIIAAIALAMPSPALAQEQGTRIYQVAKQATSACAVMSGLDDMSGAVEAYIKANDYTLEEGLIVRQICIAYLKGRVDMARSNLGRYD